MAVGLTILGWGDARRSHELRTIAPEPGLSTLVSDSKYANFRFAQVVDDAVREPAQREPPHGTAPKGTKARPLSKQRGRPLELGDERVTEFLVRLASVELRALDQVLFRLARKRQLHESARLAR